MHILGINAYHGDVSAVLIRDGRLVAALEEERFRRVKHWAGFPTESIRKCLAIGGISGADVDCVAISRDPKAHLGRKTSFVLRRRPDWRLVMDRLKNSGRVRDIAQPLAEALGVSSSRLPAIHHVEHHPAHLASAFFVSPFEEAAVCAIDGFGDFVSTSMGVGRGNSIEVLDRVFFPHSLGILYTAITQYLGFTRYGDEFKVMGLAPYGRPRYSGEISRLVRLLDDGGFELDLDYFRHWSDDIDMSWDDGHPTLGRVYSDRLVDLLGPARRPDQEVTRRHEDIARSVQIVFERSVFHILRDLWERTGFTKLCLAGGCAMNSVANGKITRNTPFREVYVQPAAADNGTALGAAYWVWNQEMQRPRSFVMDHAFWGTEYPDATGLENLNPGGDGQVPFTWTHYATSEETCHRVARLLADGMVVGWFQGRMEWGARALGNRSILADPRRADMRDLINSKIKFRERFRPFAPSVKESALDRFFRHASPDPFMQQVYPVREDKRHLLPAITHEDGTGRLQTVSLRQNPIYYRLLDEFEAITGIPVLLNTSFNENEPIVDTPQQAIECFLRTEMDAVVINNTVIVRQPAGTNEPVLTHPLDE